MHACMCKGRNCMLGQRSLKAVKISGIKSQWLTQEKISGVFKVLAGLVGGPGAEPPEAGEFSKICNKIFLRKLQKMHYFSIFFEKI